jgi:hypothetical protein
MARKKNAWVLVVLGICLALAVCCSTRRPAKPSNDETYQIPDQIEKVIFNLQKSIKSVDVEKYLECFSDTFYFTPDRLDSLEYSNITPWSENKNIDEKSFITNLNSKLNVSYSGDVVIYPEITDTSEDSINIDTLYFNPLDTLFPVLYRFYFSTSTPANPLPVPGIVSGYADLTIKKQENYYYIYRWTDKRRLNFPSLGALKAIVR